MVSSPPWNVECERYGQKTQLDRGRKFFFPSEGLERNAFCLWILKNIIIGSKDYEEEFVRAQLSVILEERFEREREGKIARQHAIEQQQREFELEKIRLEIKGSRFESENLSPLKTRSVIEKFKKSPETFRQKFMKHQRIPARSWRDFVFEITSYFEEWLDGMESKRYKLPFKQETKQPTFKPTCYSCGRVWHTSRVCHAGNHKKTLPKSPNQCCGNHNERFQEPSSAILTAKVAISVYSPTKEDEKINELKFVHIQCGNEILKAVIDTGAQISVIREDVVKGKSVDSGGTIQIMSVFGEQGTFIISNRYGCNIFEDVTDHISSDCQELEDVQRLELLNTLKKLSSLFSSLPGLAKVKGHNLKLKPDFTPKKMHPLRIPIALQQEVDRQINELLSLKLIEPSESEGAHPIVCVSKKNWSIRLCVDYRHLNSFTIADAYPMQNAKDLLFEVGQANYITVLDLTKGYWQIPMAEEAKPYTVFVTHHGHYQFCVMPFGMKNAGSTFQKVMDQVLVKHRAYCRSYIDDVAVFSKSWEQHICV
ncbi:hypothetical protein TNCV_1618531 [Trichonephila clavipes]|nr:hypothetical protein TNCV_1618531 [Trichonephila clavipes]